MKRVIYILVLSLTVCCVKPGSAIKYSFENNLSMDVDFLYPKRYTYEVPFSWGTMYDLDSTDTTSTAAWHANFTFMHLPPNSIGQDESGYSSIEEMSPYDTVRIFVFDGRYHYLPYNEVNQDELYESEGYLCRYDLTSKDLLNLIDPQGNIGISFPPSIEMKKVKMFPKYEEICVYNKE